MTRVHTPVSSEGRLREGVHSRTRISELRVEPVDCLVNEVRGDAGRGEEGLRRRVVTLGDYKALTSVRALEML